MNGIRVPLLTGQRGRFWNRFCMCLTKMPKIQSNRYQNQGLSLADPLRDLSNAYNEAKRGLTA